MHKGKVLLLAHDADPSRCFLRLEPTLKAHFQHIELIVGDGKCIEKTSEEIVSSVHNADLVCLGMPSSGENAKSELLAGQTAIQADIKFGFYGDVPKCYMRARYGTALYPLAQKASFYLGISSEDANGASCIFSNAQVFGVGNPLREDAAFPKYSRHEIREKLNIGDKEKLVLVSGDKFPAATLTSWVIVSESLHRLSDANKRFHLCITQHPGDRTAKAVNENTKKSIAIHEDFVCHSPVPTTFVASEFLSTSQILPGVDLVVDFAGSAAVHAAYHQIPVIILTFQVRMNRLRSTQGSEKLEVLENQVAELANCDIYELCRIIDGLLFGDQKIALQRQQHLLYPKPEKPGAALEKIVTVIKQILDSK